MIVFFSGGSAIVETSLPKPNVMLSMYVNVSRRTGKPDSRLKRIIKVRKAIRRSKNG